MKEKKDYQNLVWLKHQVYDLKRSLFDIAKDQNTSIYAIRKFLGKLEEQILNEQEGKMTKFCIHCGQELPIKAKYCIRCGKKSLDSEKKDASSEDQTPMFPPISDLIQKPENLEPQKEAMIPTKEEPPPEPLLLIKEKEIAEIEIPRVEVEELEPISLVPPEEEKVPIQKEEFRKNLKNQ
jgi:ribosomal protein L40E